VLLASEPAFTRFVYCVREFLGLSPASAPAPSRERIEEIFDRALDLAPAERPAFLASACGEDAELRVAVGRLLASAEATGVTARLAGAIADALEPESRDTAPPALPHYEVLERLGAGAMGVVFKACDRRLNRLVALKLLADYGTGEPAMRRRFVQEAKAAASLDHPNICAVYGFEEMPDGRLAIIMPYYEGETLRAKLDRGPLPAAEALDYAAQVAAGLAHAHAAGVVHRDIKPANLVVTHAGRVKILDFGIAKLADAELTRSGMILGTYAYMSPEQASGERGVDHRTDLWALGVVLYEMVAGKPPFAAETNRALLAAIQFAEPAPLASLRPDLPPDLDRLLARLLAKEPEDRISSATAALELLEHLSRLAYRATTATANRSETP
jgi:serine/threonine protein kinase